MIDLNNNLKFSCIENLNKTTFIFSEKIVDILVNSNIKNLFNHIFIIFENNIVKIEAENSNSLFNYKLLDFNKIEFDQKVFIKDYNPKTHLSQQTDSEVRINSSNVIFYRNHYQLSILKNLLSDKNFSIKDILFENDSDMSSSILEKSKIFGYNPQIFTSFDTKNEDLSFQDRSGKKLVSNNKIYIDWSNKKTYLYFEKYLSELNKEHIRKIFYKLPFNPKDVTFNYNNNIVNYNSFDDLLLDFQKMFNEKNSIKIICEDNGQYKYPKKYFYSSCNYKKDIRKILFLYLSGINEISVLYIKNISDYSLFLHTLMITDTIFQDNVLLNTLISDKNIIFNNILSFKEKILIFINDLLNKRYFQSIAFIIRNLNNFKSSLFLTEKIFVTLNRTYNVFDFVFQYENLILQIDKDCVLPIEDINGEKSITYYVYIDNSFTFNIENIFDFEVLLIDNKIVIKSSNKKKYLHTIFKLYMKRKVINVLLNNKNHMFIEKNNEFIIDSNHNDNIIEIVT